MFIFINIFCSNFQTSINSTKRTIAVFLIIFYFVLPLLVDARKLPDIRWDSSSNSIFDNNNNGSNNNTKHIINIQVAPLDRVTILCPVPTGDFDESTISAAAAASSSPFSFPSPSSSNSSLGLPSTTTTVEAATIRSKYEYSKLFMVSKEGFEKCELIDEKQLGVCATPERQSTISMVFREFSPLPSALIFEQGKSYFVITTSNGSYSGINNTRGGLCQTNNMRLEFEFGRIAGTGTETALNNIPAASTSSQFPLQTNSTRVVNSSTPTVFPTSAPNSTDQQQLLYVIHTAENQVQEEPAHLSAHPERKENYSGFSFVEETENSALGQRIDGVFLRYSSTGFYSLIGLVIFLANLIFT